MGKVALVRQVIYDYDRTKTMILEEGCWKVVVGTRESPGEGATRYTTTATAVRISCDDVQRETLDDIINRPLPLA